VSRVLLYLVRFAAILVGYAVATLAASAFIHLLFLGSVGFRPDDAPPILLGSLFFSVPFTALFVGYFAFLPSVVMMLIGEVLGQRSWLFYALAGGAVGGAVLALFWQSPMQWDIQTNTDIAFGTSRFAGSMIGSGIVGGFAYWLCAGRFAGNWRGGSTSSGPSIS
jgi:hypothetical protein